MAIYGDQLAFFPEQFRMFEYFSMKPESVASYSKRISLGKVRGCFQYMRRGELRQENDSLADVNIPTVWTRRKLITGNFIQREDETYRIVNSNNWLFEGGFYCYTLETVVGNTDIQTPFGDVNIGQNDYE